MTIYECLGIEAFLLNENIPIDLIIENLDNQELKKDARVFFDDILRVSIRASFNRNNHFLQVLEVNLKNADHINEISILIQKAIKYQVFFVFEYDERYLLLRRSFNMTMSTEYVYTEHASFCTDWIYIENLGDDFLALTDTNKIENCYDENFELSFEQTKTKTDNGDYQFFDDIIENANKLNIAISESEVVCLRFLIDWLAFHSAGYRLNIYDILDKIRELEGYQMIDDNLFLDKLCIRYVISELEHSKFRVTLDHTGRNPMFYFTDIEQVSSYVEADAFMLYLLYGKKTDSFYDEDIVPKEIKKYVRYTPQNMIANSPAYYTPRLKYVDEIIRRYSFRGFHLIEDSAIKYTTQRALKQKGYQVFEQLCCLSISELTFLEEYKQIDLILRMDEIGLRFLECSYEQYPSINDYFKVHFWCEKCGEPLQDVGFVGSKYYCGECKRRHERIKSNKDFSIRIANFNYNQNYFDAFISIVIEFYMKTETLFIEDIELIDVNICSSIKKISFDDFESCDENEKRRFCFNWQIEDFVFYEENPIYLEVLLKNCSQGKFHLFIYKLNEYNSFELYDYICDYDYKTYELLEIDAKTKRIISQIANNLNSISSLEICLENIAINEIREFFENTYIKEGPLFFDKTKTKLIMCEKCEYVECIEIPESVKIIGERAFKNVKIIGRILFPNELEEIEEAAFENIKFQFGFELPDSLIQIGNRAFSNIENPFDTIKIPVNLKIIASNSFSPQIILSFPYPYEDDVSQYIRAQLPELECKVVFAKSREPVIIDSGEGYRFSWILNSEYELFINAVGHFLPYRWGEDKETEWRKYARKIKKVIFSSGITYIAGNSFEGCDNIIEVIFPSTLQYVDISTLKKTLWYESLQSEYSVVGDGCLIKVITDERTLEIPDDVKYVSRVTDSAFSRKKLLPNIKHINFSDNVRVILSFAFSDAAIESVLFNDGLLEIGQQAFNSCNKIKFLCLPNSVKIIGFRAFSYSTNLHCVVLPEELETIHHNVFDSCCALEKIIVPFEENEFKKKVKTFLGEDDFPYSKCIYSTTTDNRNIYSESDLITRNVIKR